MSSSSSNQPAARPRFKKPSRRQIGLVIGLPLWVFMGFVVAQVVVVVGLEFLRWIKVPLQNFNEATFNTVVGALIYALAIFIVIGVPWLIKKKRTTRKDLGLQRLPSWLDIALVPAGAISYLILTAVVSTLGLFFLRFVDYSQVQNTGFSGISPGLEYILAFITLVIVAPVAEEVLFRGYLFGKLRKYAPLWLAILITSILFAVVHFQWNVGLDVFALSIVLCLLRVVSGSLWPSILLHMLKNGLAFYLLFINPSFLSTLGG